MSFQAWVETNLLLIDVKDDETRKDVDVDQESDDDPGPVLVLVNALNAEIVLVTAENADLDPILLLWNNAKKKSRVNKHGIAKGRN